MGLNAFSYASLGKLRETTAYDEEQYSQLVDERNEAVSRHNELVEQNNELVVKLKELADANRQYQVIVAQYEQAFAQIKREAEQAQSYEGLMNLLRLILGW
ncbi:hypothetical protein ES705_22362 [subsurface metagenome]